MKFCLEKYNLYFKPLDCRGITQALMCYAIPTLSNERLQRMTTQILRKHLLEGEKEFNGYTL